MNGALKYLSIGLIGASALFGGCALTNQTASQSVAASAENASNKESSEAKLPPVNYEEKIAELTDTLKSTIKNAYSKYGSAYLSDTSSKSRISFGIDRDGAENISVSFSDSYGFSYSVDLLGGKNFVQSTMITIKKDGNNVASFLDYYGLLGFNTDSITNARTAITGLHGLDFAKILDYSDQALVQGIRYESSSKPIVPVNRKFNKNYFEILSMALSTARQAEAKALNSEADKKKKRIEDQIETAKVLPFEDDENIRQAMKDIEKLAEDVRKESDRQLSLTANLQKAKDSLETEKANLEKRAKSLDSAKAEIENARKQSALKNADLEKITSEIKAGQDSISKINSFITSYSADLRSAKASVESERSRLESQKASLAQQEKDIELARAQIESLDKFDKDYKKKSAQLDSLNLTYEKKRKIVDEKSRFLVSYEAKLKKSIDSLNAAEAGQMKREHELDSESLDIMEKTDKPPVKMEVKTKRKLF